MLPNTIFPFDQSCWNMALDNDEYSHWSIVYCGDQAGNQVLWPVVIIFKREKSGLRAPYGVINQHWMADCH
jgi:hypothetical protein